MRWPISDREINITASCRRDGDSDTSSHHRPHKSPHHPSDDLTTNIFMQEKLTNDSDLCKVNVELTFLRDRDVRDIPIFPS